MGSSGIGCCGGRGGRDSNMYTVFIKNIILSCIIFLSHLILYKDAAVVLMYSFT